MKKTLQTLFLLAVCAWMHGLQAQTRYLQPVFSDVEVGNITPIGTNYTVLTWIAAIAAGSPNGHTARQPLVTRIIKPKGDTETKRPLVVYIHTGNFFPFPNNGSCGGTMADSSNVEIATRLAKMGYVVAIVNYRQGWLPTASSEPVRRFSLINAAYRGVQDMSTYVRYFKRSVKEFGNPFGIDTSKITLWGQGTGGYLSLASAYLNNYPEIFNTADPLKFVLTTPVGAVPMVIEQYNGNIDGTTDLTKVDPQYNALTMLPIGDTLCVSNHKGYNSDFALCVNMGGALGDSSWIDKGEVPLISYHVPSDAFAPYKTKVLAVPTAAGPQNVVEVSGSYDIGVIADREGNNNIFKAIPAEFDPIGQKKSVGLLGLCAFDNTPNNTSSPWEWIKDGVALPVANCNNDPVSPRLYIDTILQYFAPRACVALGLNCFPLDVKEISDKDIQLSLAPNPALNVITITTSSESPIADITLMDLSGRQLKKIAKINASNYSLQRDQLRSGLYIIQINTAKGKISKKIIFE